MKAEPHAARPNLRSVFLSALLLFPCGATYAQGGAQSAPAAITLPGEVRAYQQATLTAKVAGYLKSLPVDRGDTVRAGQLIADIEVPELTADRAQYKAQLDVASANFNRVQQASKSAPDLVTVEALDEARGKMQVAQAQLDRVDTLLRYARITAPFAGIITARYVDPGAFIPVPTSADQKSAAIVTLMDFRKVRIQVPVPEDDAFAVIKGMPASFTVEGLPHKVFQASVTRISYALDQGSKTMTAEIEFDNPDGVLRPGMYAKVQLGRGGPAR